jgi:hypothetical protein
MVEQGRGREESSFFEKKEAKKLFFHWHRADERAGIKRIKFFCFFLFTKRRFLPSPCLPSLRRPA